MSTSSDPSKYSKKYSSEEIEKVVLDLLEGNTRGLNINDISKMLSINRNTVSKWLNTLEAKHKIISRKQGVSNFFYKVEHVNDINPGIYVITIEIVNRELRELIDNLSSENLDNVNYEKLKEKFDTGIIIRVANNMYLNRIGEVSMTVEMSNLFSFYPFKDYSTFFYSFLLKAISSVEKDHETYSERKSFAPEEDGKKETFLINVLSHSDNPYQYDLNIQDLSLLRLLEEQLINTDSVSKILNLIDDKYITIQSNNHKVIMANKLALNVYYNGKEIAFETIKSFDFFNVSKVDKINFVGQKALETHTKESAIYPCKVNESKKNFTFTAIPIKAHETDLEGYILVVEEAN